MSRIRNYTSTVPATKSIMEIEKRLVSAGCTNIVKTYMDGQITGLIFTIRQNERDIPFRMPARVERIREKLAESMRKPRRGTMDRLLSQADRTAWKLLSDWVDVQLSLVELGQADMVEIFLPYAYDHKSKSTLYDRVVTGDLKLLT